MNTMEFEDEVAARIDTPSVEGGERTVARPYRRQDLSTVFVMRDLGMSGVAGGRRAEPLSSAREALLAGKGLRDADESPSRPRTIALQDGLRITFSSADRLMGET